MAAIMAPTFPSIVLIGGVAVTGVFDGLDGSVYTDVELGTYNIMGKIEIETAKVDSKYVHLRFTHTNKYWSRNNAEEGFVVAQSTVPEEDTSKPSCTLFEPVSVPGREGYFQLIHVQSGGRVRPDVPIGRRYVVRSGSTNNNDLRTIDWDSVVKLPPMVAFKGYNGKYLRYYKHSGSNNDYMQFSSEDPNEVRSVYQVELLPYDGCIMIKSRQTGGYWRLHPDWVLADGQSTSADTMYQPFRGQNNKIALKNYRNNLFCRSISAYGATDLLAAQAATMINEALMEVEELVSERHIYNVTYRMNEARIFNEQPYLAGTSTLINNTDQEASQSVTITYTDEKSYTFSRGFTLTAGVSTTVKAGVPFFAEAEITIAFEISGTFNWDTTTTRTSSVEASTTVTVPPRSTVVVRYVGTKGTCNIPYTYTQQDRSSINGQVSNIPQTDGIYNGVSCYNFEFVTDEVMPL